MSADNWGVCPRCNLRAEMDQKELIRKANEAYGQVEPDVYLEMRARGEKVPDEKRSFREDYQIGTNPDGSFDIDYRGGCEECGLMFEYKYETKIPGALEIPAKAPKKKR